MRRVAAIAATTALLLAVGEVQVTAAERVPVSAHLDAANESTLPGCAPAPYPPFLNCSYVYYRGQGRYSGDLTGTVHYSGYGVLFPNGNFVFYERDTTFTGAVRPCGEGSFKYSGGGSVRRYDAEAGGFVADWSWGKDSSSASGDLRGLVMGVRGPYVLRPDGSVDADFTGFVDCGDVRATAQPQRGASRRHRSRQKRCRQRSHRPRACKRSRRRARTPRVNA